MYKTLAITSLIFFNTFSFSPKLDVAAKDERPLSESVENGLKYNRSEFPEVKVKYKFNDRKHLITVEDNGIGIEEEYYKTIFEMFKRLNNKEHYEGTGMGLAICKKIVERYNGNIWIESQPNSGSRFHLSFPMN